MKRALVSTVAVYTLLSSKYCFQLLPCHSWLRLYLHLLRKQILQCFQNPLPKLFFQILFLHRVQLTF